MKRTPQVVPDPALPTSVTIYEVGPRDGLQNEDAIVPVEIKAEFIRRLVAAGLQTIEVTSFVHPTWVPQLADAEQLVDAHRPDLGAADARARAERARTGSGARQGDSRHRDLRVGDRDVRPAQPQPQPRRAVHDVRAGRGAGPRRRDAGPRLRLDVLRRPVGGRCPCRPGGVRRSPAVRPRLRRAVPRRHHRRRARRATSRRCSAASRRQGCQLDQLAMHFHDTYGQALSNALTAMRLGVTTFDASAGGLGGCPYAESATGNLATEDLVWQLAGLGIDTGVDLEALVATSVWMAEQIGKPPASRVVTARRARAATSGVLELLGGVPADLVGRVAVGHRADAAADHGVRRAMNAMVCLPATRAMSSRPPRWRSGGRGRGRTPARWRSPSGCSGASCVSPAP